MIEEHTKKQGAAEIIAEAKRFVPQWCRIMRVQRDIPSKIIKAGVNKTNLRQYIEQLMKKKRIKCRCIRCREPKLKELSKKIKILEPGCGPGFLANGLALLGDVWSFDYTPEAISLAKQLSMGSNIIFFEADGTRPLQINELKENGK